jgi:hypothetical protein
MRKWEWGMRNAEVGMGNVERERSSRLKAESSELIESEFGSLL